jgi:hypothetical protein
MAPTMMTRRTFLQLAATTIPALCLSRWAGASAEAIEYNLSFLETGLTLRRRRAWAVDSPDLRRLTRAAIFDKLTVHHSGENTIYTTDEDEVTYDIQNIHTGHARRRYGDIGYHFVVDYAGRVWEGRELFYEGAHVSDRNERNIGVLLLGNFEEQYPSREQLASLKILTDLLCRHFTIPLSCIFGHCDLGHSVCPGRNLYSYTLLLRNTPAESKGLKA